MKRNLAFGRNNFIFLAIGVLVIIVGFILMSGSSSSVESFEPDIFSTMRIKVAPVVCLIGFLSIIFAVLYRPKITEENDDDEMTKVV